MGRADQAVKLLKESGLEQSEQFELLELFVEDLEEHSEATALDKLQTSIDDLK